MSCMRSHYLFTGTSLVMLFISLSIVITGCSNRRAAPEEEIMITPSSSYGALPDSLLTNAFSATSYSIRTNPHHVVLTGLSDHRLITFYKKSVKKQTRSDDYYSSYSYYYDEWNSEYDRFFMPGIDLLHGYNLLNVGHYDLKKDTFNYLFDHPVLVKSVYFPSRIQDSIDNKPINRDYFLLSAYTEDSNADSLINRKDMRRFFLFNSDCSQKLQLVPSEYSVVRSQYDKANDVMYLFANLDENKNGQIDKDEPLHVFWISLKSPIVATQITP